MSCYSAKVIYIYIHIIIISIIIQTLLLLLLLLIIIITILILQIIIIIIIMIITGESSFGSRASEARRPGTAGRPKDAVRQSLPRMGIFKLI